MTCIISTDTLESIRDAHRLAQLEKQIDQLRNALLIALVTLDAHAMMDCWDRPSEAALADVIAALEAAKEE